MLTGAPPITQPDEYEKLGSYAMMGLPDDLYPSRCACMQHGRDHAISALLVHQPHACDVAAARLREVGASQPASQGGSPGLKWARPCCPRVPC